jgi:DNA-binding MarR family transcriptional regulator
MAIRDRILDSLFNRQITSAVTYHVFAYLGTLADENGIIQPDEHGRLPSNPIAISEALDISLSTVWKAFTRLEAAGYIQWDRALGADAKAGTSGRVRIILTDHATAA